jgi:hypothetical protein
VADDVGISDISTAQRRTTPHLNLLSPTANLHTPRDEGTTGFVGNSGVFYLRRRLLFYRHGPCVESFPRYVV